MKVHEYQGKEVLERFGVAVQPGKVATTVDEVEAAARALQQEFGSTQWVIKAQIHAGGRGKGGGVKFAKNFDDVRSAAEGMLGMMLKTHQTGPEGQEVRSVLVTDAVDIEREYYLGITLDRSRSMNVVMASTEGGVEIEQVAEATPEKIHKAWIDPITGFRRYHAAQMAFALGFEGDQMKKAIRFVTALYKAYDQTDASIAEINPLVMTKSGDIIALDAKVNFDDNALFRHPDIAELHDPYEEDPLEVEAKKYELNYVKLDGNVGCMVNGAGLAMATMDIIKLAGGEPANFLDVGGGASPDTVEAGFRIILEDPSVKAILVNIFGGIVRCDRVAAGIVEAAKNVSIDIPLIVRLQGTNAEEGLEIINQSGLRVQTAILLKEAADRVTSSLAELDEEVAL